MLLRVAVRSIARRLPSHANKVVTFAGAKVAVPKSVRWFSDDAGKAALEDYKKVIAELVGANVAPKEPASIEELLEWDKQKLETLSLDQLEELGRVWFNGVEEEFPTNLTRAFEVWTVAAKMGSAESGYSRAVMIREGKGVPQDAPAAFQALMDVANSKNYAMAHYAVAIMLTNGEGVEKNYEQAYHHNWQAALGGIVPAVFNLANAHAAGHGVPQSDTKAVHFYETAVKCEDPVAKFTLGNWLYKGKGVEKPDKKRAFQLQLEAAEAGHHLAMYNTGAAYLEGTVVGTNYAEAARWFEQSALRGLPEAGVNLAMIYRRGLGTGEIGVPKNLHKAREILKKFEHIPMAAELVAAVEEEIRLEEK